PTTCRVSSTRSSPGAAVAPASASPSSSASPRSTAARSRRGTAPRAAEWWPSGCLAIRPSPTGPVEPVAPQPVVEGAAGDAQRLGGLLDAPPGRPQDALQIVL